MIAIVHSIYSQSVHAPALDAGFRHAKLGQIQGGLQRAIQDSTKGGLQYFFIFYALKIELFRVFTLSNRKKAYF